MDEDLRRQVIELLKLAVSLLDPAQKNLNRVNRDGTEQTPQLRLKKEEFPAVCAKCHNECMLSFKPRNDSPIYCRECYKAKQGY